MRDRSRDAITPPVPLFRLAPEIEQGISRTMRSNMRGSTYVCTYVYGKRVWVARMPKWR